MTLSMYELHQPLSVERKTHFWEWFDGDALHSRWTKTDLIGTGTFAMEDNADGGFKISTGTSNNNESQIDFNDIRHYSNTSSVYISVMKTTENTSHNIKCGLSELQSNSNDTSSLVLSNTSNSFVRLRTATNGSNTQVDTSNGFDTNFHTYKIMLNSASSTLHTGGVLEAVSTTNLPDVKLQPIGFAKTLTAASRSVQFRYMEAYNT